MIKKSNKKAAVEMSLNLIIMLIIGMVVLGLVIGFVNSLVNKGTESFDRQLGDNEKLKLEEVKSCPDNLCVNPTPSLSIKKGSKVNVFIKVRAYDTAAPIENCLPGDLNACTNVIYKVFDSEGVEDSTLLSLSGPGFTASSGSEDSQMYTLRVSDETPVGTYYMNIVLYPDTDAVSKTITINVE